MKQLIFFFRLGAYACGIGGLALTLWGQSAGAETGWTVVTGRILLGVMFVAFIAAYTMQAMVRPVWRRSRRRRPGARGPEDSGASAKP